MSSKVTKFKHLKEDVLAFIQENNITTVSFDVFDTLLHRRCEPDAVIDGVTSWLNNYLSTEFSFIHVDSLSARHEAYAKIIEQKADKGLDLDTTLEEMLPVWIEIMLPSDANVDREELITLILEKELEFEFSACYANIFSLNLIKELKRLGLKVIYISDMYLGKKIVDTLLDKNGYQNIFDEGYVSGDYSLLKRTGRLFEHVINSLELDRQYTLHIGDNYEADYIHAKSNGLRAFFIGDRALDYKKNTNKFDYLMSKKDPFWKGFAVASFAKSTPYEIGSSVEVYSKRNFGPLFASFIHRVIERCVEERVDKIYFLSREGFLLGMIYNELIDSVKNASTIHSAHYLYVSRLTTFLAALPDGKLGLREIRSISDNVGGALSIEKLLSPFKINQDEIQNIATKYGLLDIKAVLPHFYLFWTPFINFINDKELQALVYEKYLQAKQLLMELLKQEGFFEAGKVAIIDVGWGGQIQENIYQAVKEESNKPDILGLYMATNLNAHTRKTPDNWMEWVISDEAHLDWDGFATFDFVQSFEAIARAPHATVVEYQRQNGRIQPVFKDDSEISRQAEIEDDQNVLGLMQQGIMEYARYYKQGIQIFNATASDTIPYAKTKISTAIRFPSKLDATYLLSLRNSSDLGMNDILALGSNEKTTKFSLNKMKQLIRSSFWGYGTAANLWGFPMQLSLVFNKYKNRIPMKNNPLAPGIVWSNAKLNDKENKLSKNSQNRIIIDESYIDLWQKNTLIGEKGSKKILKNIYDKPIGLKEFVFSQLSFYIVKVLMFIFKRHNFYYAGISRKKFILRYFAGLFADNKLFIKVYKKIFK